MIARPLPLVAALLLASPALAQPEVREDQLLGDWCAGTGSAFHEEFSLEVEDGVRTFRSWLHHRPAGSGTWELAGRALTVRSSSGEVTVYEIRTVTRRRLVLRTEDGTKEVYQREGCVEFEEPPAPQSDQE
jgi:hypothetical protein